MSQLLVLVEAQSGVRNHTKYFNIRNCLPTAGELKRQKENIKVSQK